MDLDGRGGCAYTVVVAFVWMYASAWGWGAARMHAGTRREGTRRNITSAFSWSRNECLLEYARKEDVHGGRMHQRQGREARRAGERQDAFAYLGIC